jgi:pSer/pThr/pTyr-binding forkhead associated (FHA) protein
VIPSDAMVAAARSAPAGRLLIVLEPLSHPELAPIRIHETLFAIGRTEAPFDGYPAALAGDLSRRHARIFCEQGAVYFAELGSKNGSTVNETPVRQAIAMLRDGDGDVLGLGKTLRFRVRLEPAALQPPPARLASLTLTPEHEDAGLQPIVVTEFPFLVSKSDDTFARYRDVNPAQVNYLSRRHAHIFLKGGRLHVEDLGSTNGTFVNGTRLEEHAVALEEGDVLAFGGRHFVYGVGLQWDVAAYDPTLTRIGVRAAGATPGADARADADIDRTTFVATADSFLDIFCVEPAAAAQEPPDAAASPANPVPEPGQGSAAVLRRLLHPRLVRPWGIAAALALVLASALVLTLLRTGSAEREVAGLLADGAYARAASAANEALVHDSGNAQLQAMGSEALLKAHLPGWMAQLKAGQFSRAAVSVGTMRRLAAHNPELLPLLDQLDWIVALQSFVAARGGAQVPLRDGADGADGARIRQFLQQWEARSEAYQRGFVTMSAQVPAFRDTWADALSNVRGLALARTAS